MLYTRTVKLPDPLTYSTIKKLIADTTTFISMITALTNYQGSGRSDEILEIIKEKWYGSSVKPKKDLLEIFEKEILEKVHKSPFNSYSDLKSAQKQIEKIAAFIAKTHYVTDFFYILDITNISEYCPSIKQWIGTNNSLYLSMNSELREYGIGYGNPSF